MTAMMMVMTAVVVMLFVLTAADASALTKTVKQGVKTKVVFGANASSSTIAYYKIRPTKTGTIQFTVNPNYSGYVSLCNARKKVISKYDANGEWIWGDSSTSYFRKVFFGVKKGTTYFIKVKGYSYDRNDFGNYVGYVKWTNAKFKQSKYGKSKKKAKAIKKKKTVKGLFIAGKKKAQWFKITNKQKKTRIYLKSPRTNGTIKIKAYYKSYGRWYNVTYSVYRGKVTEKLTGTISKKVKHTYYLKIYPDKKSSGNFTLRWK